MPPPSYLLLPGGANSVAPQRSRTRKRCDASRRVDIGLRNAASKAGDRMGTGPWALANAQTMALYVNVWMGKYHAHGLAAATIV